MSREIRYLPVSKAAARCGVTTRTFKRWMELDGFVITRFGAYERCLISEADFEAIVSHRTPGRKYAAVRRTA